jgi:hypothetical protein
MLWKISAIFMISTSVLVVHCAVGIMTSKIAFFPSRARKGVGVSIVAEKNRFLTGAAR